MSSKTDEKRPRGRCKPCTYKCKVWTMISICVLLASIAVVLVYFLVTGSSMISTYAALVSPTEKHWTPQCPSEDISVTAHRFDCYPENVSVPRDTCYARGCCFIEGDITPRCIYPRNYGYVVRDEVRTFRNGLEIPLTRLPAPSRYGNDIHVINVLVEMQTRYRLRIKFYDPTSERFEVHLPKIPTEQNFPLEDFHEQAKLYSVIFNAPVSPFAVKVLRAETNTTLFDTSAGALILSHQFLELSSFLPSSNVYGFGGRPYKEMNSKTTSFFADPTSKISGVHPMYLCVEKDGNSHGVLFLNSNAMEIKLLSAPAITFRTIGGILDFYIFLGPTPEDVVKQYTEIVGKPFLPPYWSLGLHLSYSDLCCDENIEKCYENSLSKIFPVDVLTWEFHKVKGGLDGIEKHNSLLTKMAKLHADDQKSMITLEPTIRVETSPSWNSIYRSGLKQKVYVLNHWGTHPQYGKVNGSTVAYLDYGNNAADKWWRTEMKRLGLDAKFDGFLLTDNDPLSEADGGVNGCVNDDLNRPPYIPGMTEKPLYSQTLCMGSVHHWHGKIYRHYDLHNLYGHSMVKSTEQALAALDSKHRKLIISHSTFVGTGHYAGQWIKHVNATWEGLRSSIATLLDLALHGIPFIGSNVCGGDAYTKADEELCLRWIKVAVFYPLTRIPYCKVDNYSKDFFRSVRHAANQRYELLPYLYTLFYHAHTKGSTVMRPLFIEFSKDNKTYSLKTQFMWGPSLLISPTLTMGTTQQEFYLPHGLWYDFYSGAAIKSQAEWFNQSTALYDDKPALLHVRGGHIIVLQQASNTTKESRKNSMKLMVALNEKLEAEGYLFWDDGESRDSVLMRHYLSVHFELKNNSLLIQGNLGSKAFQSNIYIEHVQILGLHRFPKTITINKYKVSEKQKHWNSQTQVLDIRDNILIPLDGTTLVRW